MVKDNEKIQEIVQNIADKINSNIAQKGLSKSGDIVFNNSVDDEFISIDRFVFDGIKKDYFALICTKYHSSVFFEVVGNIVTFVSSTIDNDQKLQAILERTLKNTAFAA